VRWRKPPALVALAAVAASGWLAWPWLAPTLWPAAGGAAIVVLSEDPRRTTAALDLWQQDPTRQLVIQGFPYLQGIARRQIAARQPGPAALARVTTLTCGVDTVGQLTCLADWIRSQSGSLPLGQVTLVTDQPHLPRAQTIAEIVLGAKESAWRVWGCPSTNRPKTRCGACATNCAPSSGAPPAGMAARPS